MGCEKETHYFFRNFNFLRFSLALLISPPFITVAHFGFQATDHSYSPINVIFGLRVVFFWSQAGFSLGAKRLYTILTVSEEPANMPAGSTGHEAPVYNHH